MDAVEEKVEKEEKEEGKDVSIEIKDTVNIDGIGDVSQDDADFLHKSKRFKEIYGKMKGFEREVQKLKDETSSSKTLIDEMAKHNKSLVKAMKESVKEIASDRNVKDEKAELDSMMKELNSNMEKLIEMKASALKDFDYKGVAEIDEQLADLRDKKKEIKNYSPKDKKDKDDDHSPFEEFIEKAPWYDEDPLMKAAARALDEVLVKDPKWAKKPVEDRLEEVRTRIEKRFGYKPESKSGDDKGGDKKGGAPDGLDGGGGQRGGTGKTIKLSQDQLKVATGLGLTPQEYAEQLYLMNGGKL